MSHINMVYKCSHMVLLSTIFAFSAFKMYISQHYHDLYISTYTSLRSGFWFFLYLGFVGFCVLALHTYRLSQ